MININTVGQSTKLSKILFQKIKAKLQHMITLGYRIHSHIIISIYNVLVEPKWSLRDVLFNEGKSSEVVESESV